MATDRPTASVTGKGDWEWNRWRDEVRSRPGPERDRRSVSTAADVARRQTRPAAHGDVDRERRIRELEAELERTRDRLQSVVDHYERLLTEKHCRLADQQAGQSNDGAASVLATLRRFVARR
jgi:hypothetical protein